MTRLTAAAIGTLAMFTMVVACGSDEPQVTATKSDDATAATATEPTDFEVPPTTVEVTTTTEAPTTTLPETTVPVTTIPETTIPETTVPLVPQGWVAAQFPDAVFPPCCASNWTGTPSPAAPTDPAAPLADGMYRLTIAPWSADRPDDLDIEVRRFDQCGVLPEGACEFYDSYAPDELGVEDTVIRTQTVHLDDTMRAGVVGWGSCTGDPQYGNGSDLGVLINTYNSASQSVIAPRLAAGEDPTDILTSLSASPTGGFAPVVGECANEYMVQFDTPGAPSLLLQTVYSYNVFNDTGAYETLQPMELLYPTTLLVENGVYTLYFYAGFYS